MISQNLGKMLPALARLLMKRLKKMVNVVVVYSLNNFSLEKMII
jgi:hypothetical protein